MPLEVPGYTNDADGTASGSEVGQDGSVTERTICFVYTQPAAGREAEYNDWYDRQHLPDVARVPGVVSAQRFDAVEMEPGPDESPRFLAIYEIDGDAGEFVKELRSRAGTDQMQMSDALDVSSISMTFWKPRVNRLGRG